MAAKEEVEAETPPVQDDVPEEKKDVIPSPQGKIDDSKALVLVDKTSDSTPKKNSGGSLDRDIALANLEKEKSLSFVRAWEESEKTKAENKAQKKLSDVTAWENSKKVSLEAKLQKLEEEYDRKKAEYAEKMKNKVALIHKVAEEKRAIVEAKRGEEVLKAEEVAAKFRATRTVPKKLLGCF
ncbi:Remorin_C domain-containing protein/Remorin_N domain-containing protein [Cephalotus follicularis]|uniref:Remorin_C domain-containing protein/Remorin_N domain-containing protein n=1 Tax=Cephalotus follicularis TaxID=3775 RepID=A0A1Q3C8N7_CEPFO|nr:Remorin_C domain-containing protein/Remorin_N domain-containing protein [Cephalotus follicularis]